MSFLDPVFFLFLFIIIAGYSAIIIGSDRLALVWVLSGSLIFYAYRMPAHLILLIAVSGVAYLGGVLAGYRRGLSSAGMRVVCVILLILPLLIFKYYDFAAASMRSWFSVPASELSLLLPLGISFYTFQNISFVVDRWRGLFDHQVSAQKYAVYIAFFPQLVAGPIVTARDFLPQIESRSFFYNRDFVLGSMYLFSGYLKKAFLADSLAGVVDPVYGAPGAASGMAVTLAVLAYAMQIYFDFSGYSDIAIGIGLWFGFRLPENFAYPYSANSFRDFWRRWHITLSRWLRDYLYIPLGGSRAGAGRMYFALLATMLLGGLWHGAHWNFVIWGAGHGLLLILERRLPLADLEGAKGRWLRGAYRVFVLASIVILWIPFRAGSEVDGFATTLGIFQALIAWEPGGYRESDLRLVLGGLAALAVASVWGERLLGVWGRLSVRWQGALLAAGAMLLLIFSPGSGAFIYFVF